VLVLGALVGSLVAVGWLRYRRDLRASRYKVSVEERARRDLAGYR
jgi:hypothetical protein